MQHIKDIIDVSVIIVNYNTCNITQNCIESLFKYTKDIIFEVILVDNNSKDDSRILFANDSRIRYIYQDKNYGFGKANNIAAKEAKGKYLFLLNSDTILISNVIKDLYSYMENSLDIAACGCNLISKNGDNTFAHGRFPSILQEFSDICFKRFYINYYNNNLSLAQTSTQGNVSNVDYISGADIFIRKSIFERMNGFDPDYFMYYEETDLFYRMRKQGLVSCILPNLSIIHLEGGSLNENKTKTINLKKIELIYKSKFLYYKKHSFWGSVFLIKIFLIINLLVHYKIYQNKIIKILLLIAKY